MRRIYTSIDIGTDTIKVVVCELYNERINLLASSSTKSRGIKRGLITDYDEAATSLRMAIEEIETKLGIKIKEVLATVPSYNSYFELIYGNVNINSENSIVTSEDVVNVLQQGIKNEEVNMEMVTIIPINFALDDKLIVSDPKGKVAKRLTSRAVIVTTPNKNVYSVMKLLEKCGLEPIDIAISGICDMQTFKNKDIEDKIGCIINIGSETTTISLYNKSIIIKNKVIEIGGKTIDNDLSYIYKTSMIEAKKVKEKFAVAITKNASVSDLYDLVTENGQIVKVNQNEISEIVNARLEEIFGTIKKEMLTMAQKELDYIIITGGTSNIMYLEKMARDIFGPRVSVGKSNIIGVRNNKYSTCMGNILYYINKQKLKGDNEGMLNGQELENLSSTKKNILKFSNESMLGKVTQYFFGE